MRHTVCVVHPQKSGAATATTAPPHGPGEEPSMSTTNATPPGRVKVRPGVYARTNGDGTTVYEISFRDSDGRQRRETVGPRMKAAEARLAQIKADMSRGGLSLIHI